MSNRQRSAPVERIGWIGMASVLLFFPAWVLFVRADSQLSFTLGYFAGVVIPCLSIAWHVWRYRPEHPVFWLGISAYYAATIPTTTLWLADLWRHGQVDMLASPPLRVASVVVSSVAAVTAMIGLLVVRRRRVATWATADAVVIGLAAACTLLVTNVLPLHSVLGWSTGFWTAGVVVSIRFVVLIAVTVTLLYSEQIRSVPLGVVLGAFLVWAVAEPIWVAGGPMLSPTATTILRVLMVSCGYAALIVAVLPAMRDVATPSVSPRPTWTVGRTIALAAAVVAPLVAVRYRPPRTDGELVVMLVAFGILLVAVVIRMRGSVLAAHRLLIQVERQADHDDLTGLPNRRCLYGACLDDLVEESWTGEAASVVLSYLDLDNLREVNARLEHVGGDHLLQAVARELTRRAGSGRTVARVGGDEFVILSTTGPDVDPADAAHDSESVALLALEALADDGYDSSGSVGTSWALLPRDCTSQEVERLLDLLLRQADLAQSAAKSNGGNRGVMFVPTMSTKARTRAELRRSLPSAWAGGQVALAYQSVLDLRSGEVVGIESLLRWTHPDLGPIAPPDAIDVAIDLGLITELGLQILERAAQDLIGSGAPAGVRVGVNLASPQLRPASTDALLEAVSSHGLGGRIWLEVTEQLLLQEERYAAGALAELREAGALVAIDDFGTGYCNLDYLCSLPVDLLKLDKLFAAHIGDHRRASVSRTVVRTAEALDAEVIAEGIEDWATADTMLDLGCQFGQGYALRRPTTSIVDAIAPIPVPAGVRVGADLGAVQVRSRLLTVTGS